MCLDKICDPGATYGGICPAKVFMLKRLGKTTPEKGI